MVEGRSTSNPKAQLNQSNRDKSPRSLTRPKKPNEKELQNNLRPSLKNKGGENNKTNVAKKSENPNKAQEKKKVSIDAPPIEKIVEVKTDGSKNPADAK